MKSDHCAKIQVMQEVDITVTFGREMLCWNANFMNTNNSLDILLMTGDVSVVDGGGWLEVMVDEVVKMEWWKWG